MNDTLIEKLREHSAHLSKMDDDNDHGIMTTIRFEEIDLVGQACIKLIELERELAAAQAQRDKALVALNSIREYWNEDRNDKAMFDACWFAINTAESVLKECWKPKVEK